MTENPVPCMRSNGMHALPCLVSPHIFPLRFPPPHDGPIRCILRQPVLNVGVWRGQSPLDLKECIDYRSCDVQMASRSIGLVKSIFDGYKLVDHGPLRMVMALTPWTVDRPVDHPVDRSVDRVFL